jgi:hypothetical protein
LGVGDRLSINVCFRFSAVDIANETLYEPAATDQRDCIIASAVELSEHLRADLSRVAIAAMRREVISHSPVNNVGAKEWLSPIG